MGDEVDQEIEKLRARLAELEKISGKKEKKRTEGTRMTTSKGKEIGESEGRLGGAFEFKENPEFLIKRLEKYQVLKAKKDEEQKQQPREPIKITLPDGKEVDGVSFETSPMDIAMGISAGLANNVVVAKVFYTNRIGSAVEIKDSSGFELDEEEEAQINRGELWDLVRPLEGSCKLELLKFDERDAKMVFWHSSAHILGECIECKLGSHLTVGPPVDPGFYYDTYLGWENGLTEDNKKKLETQAKQVIKEKQAFERIVLTKEEALDLFEDNPYKLSIIRNKIPDGSLTTAYRCGPLIDLCMGPHIPNTGKVKAFEITKASTAYWLGNAENDPLQRVYGISFPDKKLLKEHKEFMKQAAENDHRKKGEQQKLFFFHDYSPGSAFFLPHGARIFNALLKFIREEYHTRGYDEVVTPNIYNANLWKQSGHWEHYHADMILASLQDEDKVGEGEDMSSHIFGLKPMNCPGHCLMYNHSKKSYRDLPIRMADFGVLHRNEASGALSGLTRVRRFQQDDAHIFCSQDDLESEILGALNFMKHVYTTFGMTYKLERSTRPAKACGIRKEDGSPDVEGIALWDRAEDVLARVLDQFVGKGNWRDNPGDGAFYGPKIDIKVFDSMKRKHQCATIQLDFQNPIRFELEFDGPNGVEKPVMIHRAMLGSLERMIAILTEHFKGKWPFWLSPRQLLVVPIHQTHNEYAESVRARFHEAGFFCDVDDSSKTFNKRIALGQVDQYNFILVVGGEEMTADTVNIRTRANKRLGVKTVAEAIELFTKFKEERILNTEPEDEQTGDDAAAPPAAP